MTSDCCKSGFAWDGKPVGTETTIAGINTYVTGDAKGAAILMIHDIFGWTFKNLRVLADHFAKEANATVYLPDFFGGEVIPEESLTNPELRSKIDVGAFLGRNSKDVRYPEMEAVAKELKSKYAKVGGTGYCYGGWALFKLGADPQLIDAICVSHPSLLDKKEIDGLKVPVQINAPETDPQFTPELKEYANKVIPTLKIPYEYIYYPGLVHGFATRGNLNNKVQKDGLERAKNAAVNFLKEFLH